MGTLRIIMAGLMCHVAINDNDTEENYKHVAILDEQTHHDPVVMIAGSDLVPQQGGVFQHRLRKFEKITFTGGTVNGQPAGVRAGFADADAAFRNGIPSLRVATNNGDLDSSIKAATRNNNVLAYLVYVKGDLTVRDHFELQAEYAFPTNVVIPRRCVASDVEFTADDEGFDTVMTVSKLQPDGSSTPLFSKTIRSGGTIVVMNRTSHAGAKHFEHYKRLTDAEEVVTVDRGTTCPLHTGKPLPVTPLGAAVDARHQQHIIDAGLNISPAADPDPECSNTRWP